MKVLLTGFCRSGTTSIARFFEAFGVPSFHQKMGPGEKNMRRFDFRDPPEWAAGYIARKGKAIREGEGFEASWEFAHYLYSLTMEAPESKWLVMLRQPSSACSSLKAYNRRGASIEGLAGLYLATYRSLLEQIRALPSERKPRWMDFGKYVAGDYSPALLALFSLRATKANLARAEALLSKKVRSSGAYPRLWCETMGECWDAAMEIKRSCGELR